MELEFQDETYVAGRKYVRRVGVVNNCGYNLFVMENNQSIIPLLHYFEQVPESRREGIQLCVDPDFFEEKHPIEVYSSNHNETYSHWSSYPRASARDYNLIILDDSITYFASDLVNSFVHFLESAYEKQPTEKRKILIREIPSDSFKPIERGIDMRIREQGDLNVRDLNHDSNTLTNGLVVNIDSNSQLGFPPSIRKRVGVRGRYPLTDLEKRIVLQR